MAQDKDTLAHRIDAAAAARLLARELPAPVDALNLIRFADERSYRWYGLLLAPTLIPRGAWPVWVGVHERTLCGDRGWDEIVIIRYRSHAIVVEAVQSRYYSWVNRWREKGVRDFEFALTERLNEASRLSHGGAVLVVLYDRTGEADAETRAALRELLETPTRSLIYASRQVSPLDMFSRLERSDPNPATYKSLAMFALPDAELQADVIDDRKQAAVAATVGDCAVHVYTRQRNLDALPWSRLSTRG